MTTRCPNGHESTDPDWCDTCGAPLRATSAPITASVPSAFPRPAPDPAPSAGTPGVTCDHCSALNSPGSLFCESCGYDFTTGQVPVETPAPPAGSNATADVATDWSIVVDIDPQWYALKGTDSGAPCPPPSHTIVPLPGSPAMVGRTSRDRDIHPEVALDDDPGVSRRHAQFVRDADGRWSVVDLGSMNGTFVIASDASPTADSAALVQGETVPCTTGTRVYVGAWTRLTIVDNRPAEPPED